MSRRHAYLNAHRWDAVRRTVFERDNFRCVMCGHVGHLECDHIVSLDDDPTQDPYVIDGCQALCRQCHIEKTAHENRRPLTPAEAAWRGLVAEIFSEPPLS